MLAIALLVSCAAPSDAGGVNAAELQRQSEQDLMGLGQQGLRCEHEQRERDQAAYCEVPTDDEIAAADFGLPPPDGWRSIIEELVRPTLKDPESARFQFHEPAKTWCKPGEGAPFEFHWVVQYAVRSKSSHGGYAGFRPDVIFYIDGEWVTASERMRRHEDWRIQRDAARVK